MTFDTIDQLEEHARTLKGLTISQLIGSKPLDRGKGAIGNIIEREGFGIANNSIPKPDFEALGVELKVLPLKKDSKGRFSVKERTKICSINYVKLVDEHWMSSNARHKLEKILFVFYYYDKIDPVSSHIVGHLFFHLNNRDEPLIKEDWERTQGFVRQGLAHELSESQNVILAASRAGAGGQDESKFDIQPITIFKERARKRAFSLKPSYTRVLWLEHISANRFDRVLDIVPYENFTSFQKVILNKLNIWEGKSLKDFADFYGIELELSAKNSVALIVRRALGFKEGNGKIREFEQLGLNVKTIPCRKKDFYPFEAMSFPFQKLGEIAEEERFDESEFYTHLQGFLFIPLIRENRKVSSLHEITFGKSFIWLPTKVQLEAIQLEWEGIQSTIRKGIIIEKKPTKNRKGYVLLNNLPGEKETEFIHVRPHGRDSDDTDKSLPEVGISKQCFWLNKSLVQKLVKAAN